MPIVSKPRQIRIDLDPDQGFPVSISMEFTRSMVENGEKVADLAPHVDSLAPDSPQAVAAMGELAAAATAALLPYQAEVQRLAGELSSAQSENAVLRAQLQP